MILKAGSTITCFLVKPKVRHITLRVYSTLFNVFSRYRRETPVMGDPSFAVFMHGPQLDGRVMISRIDETKFVQVECHRAGSNG